MAMIVGLIALQRTDHSDRALFDTALAYFDKMPSWQSVVLSWREPPVNTHYLLAVDHVPRSDRTMQNLKRSLRACTRWSNKTLLHIMKTVDLRGQEETRETTLLWKHYQQKKYSAVKPSQLVAMRVQDDWNKANMICRYLFNAPEIESWPFKVDKSGSATLVLDQESRVFEALHLGSVGAPPQHEFESLSGKYGRRKVTSRL